MRDTPDEREMDEWRRYKERHNEEMRKRSPERRQKDEEYTKKFLNNQLRSRDYIPARPRRRHSSSVDWEPLEFTLKFLLLLACLGLSLWLFISVVQWFWQHPLW